MKRGVKLLSAIILITILTAVPVLADQPDVGYYTGWSLESAPRYYQYGILVTNQWIRFGNNLYYVGPEGYVVPNMVLSDEALKYAPVFYVDTNGKTVRPDVPRAAAMTVDLFLTPGLYSASYLPLELKIPAMIANANAQAVATVAVSHK